MPVRWKKLAFWAFAILVVVPGVPFVLVTLGLVVYMYRPVGLDELSLPAALHEPARHVVVLAHGVRDTPATWAEPLKRVLERAHPADAVVALDWNPYAADTFRCSLDGMRVGEAVGRRLAGNGALRSLHLVGHSCGAFVVLGACEAVRERRPEVEVQTTFLDPVTVYGGFFWSYGSERFGSCGAFSDAWIDTGDRVPGSNERLPLAHTFDVTGARERSRYAGAPHNWPTNYYLSRAAAGEALDLRDDPSLPSRYPRGVLQKVAEPIDP